MTEEIGMGIPEGRSRSASKIQKAPKAQNSRNRGPGLTGWRKELWDWTKALIIAAVIVLLLKAFVFQLSTVKKISMEPTLHENEWLFVNKIALRLGDLERGDVVIFKDPSAEETRSIWSKGLSASPEINWKFAAESSTSTGS